MNWAFSNGRISRHLIFAIVLCSSLVTILTTAVQLYFDYRRDLFSIRGQMDRIEAVHLASLVESLWIFDGVRIQTQIDGIERLTDVEYVAVREGENVSWTSGNRQSQRVITAEFPLIRQHPRGDRALGVLEIVASLDDVFSRLIDKALVILATNAFKTFLVAGFMLVLFQYVVTRHLTKIAQYARRATFEGTTEPLYLDRPQIRRWGENELDDVATAINHMTTNLRKSWEAQRDSEERFKDIANASADWFWEMGPDLRFTYISERFFEITGFRPEERIGTPRTHYVDPTDREADAKKWAAHLADLETHRPFKNFEYAFTSSTGRVCHARISGTPIFDLNGEFLGYRGAGTDVTERKRTEEALRTSEEKFITALNNSSEAIALYDADDCLVLWNDVYQRHRTGQPSSLLEPGLKFENLVRARAYSGEVPTAIGREEDYVAERLERHRHPGESFETQRRGGWYRYREHRTPDGGTMIVISDITDLRQRESELIKAQEIAKVGSWTWHLDEGGMIGVSDEYLRIIGFPPDQPPKNQAEFNRHIHPDDLERIVKVFDEAVSLPSDFEVEYRFVRPDGKMRHIVELGELVYDDSGRAIGHAGTIQDITDRKQAEQEIQKLNEDLERRVEERTAELRAAQDTLLRNERLSTLGQLTATVSHELRNPLGVIRTSAFTLRGKLAGEDPRAERTLDRIERNVVRCDRIIDELLDFTRISQLEPEPTFLDAWLEETLNEQTLHSGVALRLAFDRPNIAVSFDHDRFRRAIINVFDNACQAMIGVGLEDADSEENTLTVRTQEHDGRVEVIFEDTGPGIPPDVYEKIFEPLYSTKGFGVGLGLPVVKHIMEQHGGGIEIESEEGRGTRVCLWLPTSPSAD